MGREELGVGLYKGKGAEKCSQGMRDVHTYATHRYWLEDESSCFSSKMG